MTARSLARQGARTESYETFELRRTGSEISLWLDVVVFDIATILDVQCQKINNCLDDGT